MQEQARKIVMEYFNSHVDKTDNKQNGDKNETYVDVYKKWENYTVKGGN